MQVTYLVKSFLSFCQKKKNTICIIDERHTHSTDRITWQALHHHPVYIGYMYVYVEMVKTVISLICNLSLEKSHNVHTYYTAPGARNYCYLVCQLILLIFVEKLEWHSVRVATYCFLAATYTCI
jgi:hypothetical protein